MLLIAELVLLIYGIQAMISAKFTLGKKKLVGPGARVLGGICLVPLPVSFVVGFLWGFLSAVATGEAPPVVPLLIMDMMLIVSALTAVTLLGPKYLREQEAKSSLPVNASGPAESNRNPVSSETVAE